MAPSVVDDDLGHAAVAVTGLRAVPATRARNPTQLPRAAGVGSGGRVEELGEVVGRARTVGAAGDDDVGVGQGDARVVGGDQRIVPLRDLALEDRGDAGRRELQLVDARQVVRHRDRSDDGRYVHELSTRELGDIFGLDHSVGAGEVDDVRLEIATALSRTAAAVLDGQIGSDTGQRGDRVVVEALREGGATADEAARQFGEVDRCCLPACVDRRRACGLGGGGAGCGGGGAAAE